MNQFENYNVLELFEALNRSIPQEAHNFGSTEAKEYVEILTTIAQSLQKSLQIFCQETGYKAMIVLEHNYLSESGPNHDYKWETPGIYIDFDNSNDFVRFSTDGNSFYELTEKLKKEKSSDFSNAVMDFIYLGDRCSREKFFCIKEANIKITPEEIDFDVQVPVCKVERHQFNL